MKKPTSYILQQIHIRTKPGLNQLVAEHEAKKNAYAEEEARFQASLLRR
jgi:hypothetical protein